MGTKIKKSFVFNVAWQEVLMDYPPEVRLEVYDAVIRYAASGTLSELKPLAKMAFSFIKKEIDYYNERYDDMVSKRSEAGKKGMLSRYGNKKDSTNVTSDNKTNTSYQTVTNVTDNDNVNDNKETSSNEEAKKASLSLGTRERELRDLESSLKAKEELRAKKVKAPPDLDFVADNLKGVFQTWLDYKRERKESYRSARSLSACYNKLLELSRGDPETARMIVEQSMACNWAGLFPLKQEQHEQRRLQPQQTKPEGHSGAQPHPEAPKDYSGGF